MATHKVTKSESVVEHHPVCEDCGKVHQGRVRDSNGNIVGTTYSPVTTRVDGLGHPRTDVALCAACYRKDYAKVYPKKDFAQPEVADAIYLS